MPGAMAEDRTAGRRGHDMPRQALWSRRPGQPRQLSLRPGHGDRDSPGNYPCGLVTATGTAQATIPAAPSVTLTRQAR